MAQELVKPNPAFPPAVKIDSPADVVQACDGAARMAESLGFPPVHCQEISLVISELGANLLRHASQGRLTVTPLEGGTQPGIQVESDDAGPGIADVEQAITDGYSTAGGLGLGLGTVNRLMDELDIHSGARGGVQIVCRRWVRPRPSGLFDRRLAFGAASRPYRPWEENGDAFIIKQWEGNALAAVIDGLGHGAFAQRASLAARQYIEQHFDQPLDKIFRGAGRACRATRGVVMALARFDLVGRKLLIASVGNIEVRLQGGVERFRPIVRRGIVGLNAPDAVITEHPWTSSTMLIMHSDGLPAHWAWDQFPELDGELPPAIAQRLLRRLARPDDDATVVVAGNASL